MAIGTGSKTSLHYVAEVTYGTTPATPVFTPICNTGTTLGMTKDAIEAGCLRPDRQVKDVRHGNRQIGGDINTELEYGSFDDLLEAMAMGTWAADVLKAGVARRSFTFERFFDLDVNEYHRYTGCEINTLALSVSPNAMVTANFGVIGKDLDSANLTSQVAGATYGADSTKSPFDSFSGTINEGGSSIATVTQIDLNWENGIEPAFVIGSQTTIEPSDGKSRLTGTLTAYFEDSSLYLKFLNEVATSITFTLVDVAGSSIEFDMSNVKYSGGNPDVSGEGPITLALEFAALYDATDDSQIVITRTP
jgi:hypothetical protein